jgi:sortase (surface protein transpeptidase)
MKPTTRLARALRAAPILVLAFLLTGGGAAPAPEVFTANPNAAQVLAAETASPGQAFEQAGALRLPAIGSPSLYPERRVAEFTADAIAKAAADERQAERARARAEARADARAEARAEARADARAEARAEARADTKQHVPVYRGTNHFWIPSLGMSNSVHAFPCSRSRPPGNYMYRWYCAGDNNVYIMGHAYSVMKPLHDLYVSGGLHKGMTAIYANGSGKVTKYRVVSWRVVDPTESAWAIASQPVPSMTLQTCLGKRSQWRLNVRLVAVD